MTPTPPSTNSSTGGRSPEEQFRVVRKRNRVPLSCYPCRTRKKCDRSHPCSNCTKREGNDSATCSYAAPSSRRKNQNQGEPTPDDMQNRIDRLEGLVLSLMHGGANIEPAPGTANPDPGASAATALSVNDSNSSARQDHETTMMDDEESDAEESLVNSLGVLKVDPDQGKSMYIGQQHWHTLLADIAEVKNYFTYHKKELETSYERVKKSKPVSSEGGPTLFMGAPPATDAELRAALPSKSTVLTLCSRYFNSMDNSVMVLHGPTFQHQLRAHWQDPSKTPLMWLGLLYSVLCLAMLSYHKVGDEPPEWKGRSFELSAEFRVRTVQCLIRVDYTRPVDFTVETLLLYVFGEYSSRWDADLGLWMVMSLITRLSLRMGYHRDAKWFSSVTPFQAEMRRRIWAMVRMADVVFSHQVSLPAMIQESECDTQLPNSIHDDEIHPEMKSLPPSRPLTEPTPIAYMIAKARLCNELGNILQSTNRIGRQIHYDEILRYDAKLRQIMQELPPHLKLARLDGSTDPVTSILAQFNIDILFHKIMCLLHRKYLPRARNNPRYAHSRRSAIESSLRALDHLSVLHRESQANGRLRSVRWFVKSIATKDFVLPACLIILDLHFDNVSMQGSMPHDTEGSFLWNQEQRVKMIGALEASMEIWKCIADTSMEAFKAAKVVEIMMAKIKNPPPRGETGPSSMSAGSRTDSLSTLANSMGMGQSPAVSQDSASPNNPLPEYNAGANPFSPSNAGAFMGMDLGLAPMAGVDASLDGARPLGAPSPLSVFNNMAGANGEELGTNFDWGAFENYTQMANWGVDQSFQIYGFDGEESAGQPTMGTGGANMYDGN